jgi:uncharacterized RDD family membrane protein YckC
VSSTLVTPEAVLLELPTAGVATRAFARLVDLFAQVVVAMMLGFVGSFLFGVGLSPELFAISLSFTVLLVLPIGVEVLWRGRSPGKALFGLRVVGVDGAPEAPRQAVVRGLVALVDLYLTLGALAIGTATFSHRSQRAGDVAAGTVVIRVNGSGFSTVPIAFHPPAGYEAYVESLDVGLLRDEDFSLVREFLLRTGELDPERRSALAVELATSIQQRVRHTLPAQIDAELWLICVASAYQLRQGGLLADAAAGLAPLAPVVPSAPRPYQAGRGARN